MKPAGKVALVTGGGRGIGRTIALGRPGDGIGRESMVGRNALRRLVEPWEIAATAVFLASDEARDIAGGTISVPAEFRS